MKTRLPHSFSTRTLLAALLPAAVLLAAVPGSLRAADWTNSGGDAGRNALTTEIGPTAQDLLWSGSRSSMIAWHPVTEGNRVFMVRELKWPNQQPGDSPVVAMDLANGGELWAVDLPYNSGDWTAWVAGVNNGKVYASRSGNGASIAAKMYALDAADGHTVWVSQDMTKAGPYDGVVFAPDGDLIVGSFQDLWRIRGSDGTTVWHKNRVGSVSSACGAARFDTSVYIADAAPGGHVLVRYDLATGTRLYQSPLMPGFTCENTPMVGPDGTIYLNRAQNNASVDYLYAFTDDGTQFIEKWHVPTLYNPYAELGIGPDGSVYAVIPGPRLARLDPATGGVVNYTNLTGFFSSRFAIDAQGKVFFSNGGTSSSSGLFSYNADLTLRWSVLVTNINIGGPSLGQDGTVVVCGIGTDVRAYSSVDPAEAAELFPGSSSAGSVCASPNPVRGGTRITFDLSAGGPVRLEIYDVSGERRAEPLAGSTLPPGRQSFWWEARDSSGRWLPSGVYYLRLVTGNGMQTGRVMVTR